MTPHRGNAILIRSSQQLPCLRRPSRTLDSPRALLPELPIYKDTVRFACARRVGPRTQSLTTDANLDCAFVENALFYTNP